MEQKKALLKVIEEVGSSKELSNLLGISYSYMRTLLCGFLKIPPKMVKRIVALSNGLVKPNQLRPDIF